MVYIDAWQGEIIMERHICFGGQRIAYEFERKRVKNINLRIRADGTVHVSANKGVPVELAEEFMPQRRILF